MKNFALARLICLYGCLISISCKNNCDISFMQPLSNRPITDKTFFNLPEHKRPGFLTETFLRQKRLYNIDSLTNGYNGIALNINVSASLPDKPHTLYLIEIRLNPDKSGYGRLVIPESISIFDSITAIHRTKEIILIDTMFTLDADWPCFFQYLEKKGFYKLKGIDGYDHIERSSSYYIRSPFVLANGSSFKLVGMHDLISNAKKDAECRLMQEVLRKIARESKLKELEFLLKDYDDVIKE
jgi:hypothetical protein